MKSVGGICEIWRYPVKSMAGQRLERCLAGPGGIVGDRGWAVRDETAGEICGAKKLPKLMLCHARYIEEPSGQGIPPVEITLPDGVPYRSDDSRSNQRLSEFLGRDVSLWPIQPASNAEHYRRSEPTNEVLFRELLSREPDEPLPDLSLFPQALVEELFEFVSPLGTYFDVSPLHLLTTASVEALKALIPEATIDSRRFRPNFCIETPADAKGFVEFDWCRKRLNVGAIQVECGVPVPRCGMTMHEQPGLPQDPSILRTIVRKLDQNMGIYANPVSSGIVAIGDLVEL